MLIFDTDKRVGKVSSRCVEFIQAVRKPQAPSTQTLNNLANEKLPKNTPVYLSGEEKNAQEVEGEARDEKRSGVGEKEDSAQEEIIADEDIGGNEEDQEEEEVDEEGDGGGGVDKTSSVDGAEVDIARARSAWMIFLSHNREKVKVFGLQRILLKLILYR